MTSLTSHADPRPTHRLTDSTSHRLTDSPTHRRLGSVCSPCHRTELDKFRALISAAVTFAVQAPSPSVRMPSDAIPCAISAAAGTCDRLACPSGRGMLWSLGRATVSCRGNSDTAMACTPVLCCGRPGTTMACHCHSSGSWRAVLAGGDLGEATARRSKLN